MPPTHLEFLVEEQSMEAFLQELLSRILPAGMTFNIHAFQGKDDLLQKLENRLNGYAAWLPSGWRIFVIVDRDDDDCHKLKKRLEDASSRARLATRSVSLGKDWRIANRIVVEELEAWYFGNWKAVMQAFPKISAHVIQRASYRDSDAIVGGTWEAFQRVLQNRGYYSTGLPKVECARTLGRIFDPNGATSPSFNCFYRALTEIWE